MTNKKETNTTELEVIESRLKSHDWWYHMADDGNAFRRGEASAEALTRLCLAAKDQLAVKALWDKHCPLSTSIYYDKTPRPNVPVAKVP